MRKSRSTLILAAAALVLTTIPAGISQAQPTATGPAKCINGNADGLPCKNIDLVGQVEASVMGGAGIADVMGWVDPETKKEYAVLGSSDGVQFLDVTDPAKPEYLGEMVGKADGAFMWQELEIVNDHVYAVCDLVPSCGLQIFDLTRLRSPLAPVWNPDVVIPVGSAHSIDSNPDTNHIFLNGPGVAVGTPLIFDVSQPLAPTPVGVIADDGYTHDSLCRTYKGPDRAHKGNEICFNFNEDTITTYDVTANPMQPEQLSRVTYENADYTHSGALTKDHSTLISTDEGDETAYGLRSTLYIWDVRDLEKPKLIGTFVAKSGSIDHNVYSEEDALYHANYTNGFRILDLENAHKGKLKEVAYIDTMPSSDEPAYSGAWAAYPYLPSGNILVGNMGGGLFIVRPEASVLKGLGVTRK